MTVVIYRFLKLADEFFMLNWFNRRRQKAKSYRTTREWVGQLSDPPDEQALTELRQVIVRGLRSSLHSYVDRDLEHFVEDVAQDALIKILDKLDTFKGESTFFSWAMKIAVREGLSELRRKKWKDLSLEDLAGSDDGQERKEINSEYVISLSAGPDQQAHESMIITKVMEMIDNELSEKQKMAINALMVKGVSVTVVADRMRISRNALYKLVHDARVKLKKKMFQAGMDPDEILREL